MEPEDWEEAGSKWEFTFKHHQKHEAVDVTPQQEASLCSPVCGQALSGSFSAGSVPGHG